MIDEMMAPMATQGSNDLIGRDVLEPMTIMTPEEYENMPAPNAWTGTA